MPGPLSREGAWEKRKGQYQLLERGIRGFMVRVTLVGFICLQKKTGKKMRREVIEEKRR